MYKPTEKPPNNSNTRVTHQMKDMHRTKETETGGSFHLLLFMREVDLFFGILVFDERKIL